MPITTTPTHIYIGNYPDLDPNEGNFNSEDAGDLVNEVIGTNVMEFVTVTEFDSNNSGTIRDNDQGSAGGDTVSYTANGTTQTGVAVDGTMTANVRVTLDNLSTQVIEVVIYQTETGDVFVGDFANNGTLDNLNIEQIEILSITGSNYTALFTNSSVDNSSLACFVRGTKIRSCRGEIPIEDLRVGDEVLTENAGYQPIRWVGSSALDIIDLAATPKLNPIRISAGALGNGLPECDLLVSPQHRVLVRSVIAQRMFGTDEVLIAAKKLLSLDGIDIVTDNPEGVEYFHLLFDKHEIIYSNGALTESLFTGPEALKAVSPKARHEIERLFPEICAPDFEPLPAHQILKTGRMIKQLVARHIKNHKPLYSMA